MESGTHECQSAGAIPTHLSQTPLIRDQESRNILRFLPVTRYFFGKNFSRADLAGAPEWNMQRNDVILGAPSFFRVSGGSVREVGCIAQTLQHGLNSRQKAWNSTLFK